MELEIKSKVSNYLSNISYALGFINLLSLNIAIITKRNIFPTNISYVIILGVIIGLLALIQRRDIKTVLGLLMNLFTGITILIILIFSFAINPSP